MKKFILIPILSVLFSLQAAAQEKVSYIAASSQNSLPASYLLQNTATTPLSINDKTKDYAYYMHKRKNQKTIGWSLLGGGFALTGIGFLLASSNSNEYDYDHSSGKGAAVCIVAAAAAGLASIPFMIMATSNKNKAKLLLDSQKTGYGIPVRTGNVTGFTVSVPLGK